MIPTVNVNSLNQSDSDAPPKKKSNSVASGLSNKSSGRAHGAPPYSAPPVPKSNEKPLPPRTELKKLNDSSRSYPRIPAIQESPSTSQQKVLEHSSDNSISLDNKLDQNQDQNPASSHIKPLSVSQTISSQQPQQSPSQLPSNINATLSDSLTNSSQQSQSQLPITQATPSHEPDRNLTSHQKKSLSLRETSLSNSIDPSTQY